MTRKVWVCVYSHKHGTDVGAYVSEEAAHIGACSIVLEYLFDVEEHEKRTDIVTAISNRKYSRAIQLYLEATPEEAFEIVEREVANLDNDFLAKPLTKAITALAEDEDDDEEGEYDFSQGVRGKYAKKDVP